MSTLKRLFSRDPSAETTDASLHLTKGTPVVALRDLGECGQDFVCAGTQGTVTAVSRIATYEVMFAGEVRLTNLGFGDVQAVDAHLPARAGFSPQG